MDYGYSGGYGQNTSWNNATNANDGGGGFMPGSQQNGDSVAKNNKSKDTLRPVTVKQALEAHHPHPDADHFVIDKAEATQVTLVGNVRNIVEQATNTTYRLDDGTGAIEVKTWVDSDALANPDHPSHKKHEAIKCASYIRVYGRLKDYNNRRHVQATIVRPITDPNEVQYHLLDATAVHLFYKKGRIEKLREAKQNRQKNSAQQNGPNQNGSGAAGTVPPSLSHATPAARRVYTCIREMPQINEGVHMSQIAQKLGMPLDTVMKAGEELFGIGAIYTTVDDETWALLEVE